MIKKLIYILLFLPLFVSGQFNLFWNHPYEGWNLDDADYNFCYQPDGIDAGNFDIDFSSDGKYMFIIEGYTYDDYVRRWILSPPWDITTSNTLNQSLDLSGYDDQLFGMCFKPDGTKLYLIGNQRDSIMQFALSPAWSLPYPTKEGALYVGDKDYTPMDVFIKHDGTKVYFIGQENDRVHSYTLGTAWNIKTATYDGYFYIGDKENSPHSLQFDPTGSQMYISGVHTDSVYQYKLSTAWDISTANHDCSLYIGGQQYAQGIAFKKDDGSKLYTTGQGYVCQYHLNPIEEEEVNLKGNLISVWEMDETSGTTAYDAHGINNLTIGSGVDINESGILGTSFYYSDGTSDYLKKTSFYSLSGSTSFSFSFWLKPVANERNHFVSIRDGTSYIPGFYASAQPSSTDPLSPPVAVMSDGTYSVYCDEASTLINDSEWHFLVITYNGSTETMQFYIDNVLEDTAVATGTLGTLSSTLYIGNGSGYTTHRYKGWIDQIAFWEEVLNVDAISALYNSGNGKPYSEW